MSQERSYQETLSKPTTDLTVYYYFSGKLPIASLAGQRLAKELSAPISSTPVSNLSHSSFNDSVIPIVCSRRSSLSTSLTISELVAGRRRQMTIDTGSNITLVRPDVLERPGRKVTVRLAEHQLRTVTGETAPVRGTCTDDIAIGSFCTSHTLWVADITDECIIGLDFLRKHDGLVDLRDDGQTRSTTTLYEE